jgi:hypothetical protein
MVRDQTPSLLARSDFVRASTNSATASHTRYNENQKMGNQEPIDHDRLFKELISTFFLEFLELFFPQVVKYLEPESITFRDKEVFTDVTRGERYETDLLAEVQFWGEDSYFLIHL